MSAMRNCFPGFLTSPIQLVDVVFRNIVLSCDFRNTICATTNTVCSSKLLTTYCYPSLKI
ncbi:hypothetical protein Phum_PHUM057700 [Pediculus humanus corporis]|uniref:Uncharacterized protein n=1 Tax=Pediculus humanus subsp. corporis TaxID=121224 RepID=E0VBC6_PEDHC|nr:uncharacterized protein Phum_PHUM057700 [Pediculus humanus corporis]EEB10682.1 hypothetical protein Phum_PHUM057700 [Pediculus humanus corporis]